MSLPPIVSAAELATTKSVDDASRSIARAVLAMSGARQGADGWLQFRLGSALWVRLWGVWTSNAYRNLPLIVDATVIDTGAERVVRLDFRSDEGPYLVRLERVEPAYRRRFAELEEVVRASLN